MNKITLGISILVLTTLLSCDRTDFANPEAVVNSYRTLAYENKDENLYEDFLSSKSKEFVTKDEFIRHRSSVPDSLLKSRSLLDRKVSSCTIGVTNSTHRKYKVDEKYIFNKDTNYICLYYSLINENGKWKVIWTGTLLSFAKEKYNAGNYLEARKMLEMIIEIDPFLGTAYHDLAWCYLRDKSLSQKEREDGIVRNAKYALALEEDCYMHYNTLAAYYSEIESSNLAILNYERGLSYCQNNDEKSVIYSNLVGSYAKEGRFDKAEEFLKKSIAINPKSAFIWYKYGILAYDQGKIDEATEYFEKALNEVRMESSLQGSLYYCYALCCLTKNKCEISRDYVNKALDIEPNNDSYQQLHNRIKYCDANT
jgi:pentatricopeptide repeat protein